MCCTRSATNSSAWCVCPLYDTAPQSPSHGRHAKEHAAQLRAASRSARLACPCRQVPARADDARTQPRCHAHRVLPPPVRARPTASLQPSFRCLAAARSIRTAPIGHRAGASGPRPAPLGSARACRPTAAPRRSPFPCHGYQARNGSAWASPRSTQRRDRSLPGWRCPSKRVDVAPRCRVSRRDIERRQGLRNVLPIPHALRRARRHVAIGDDGNAHLTHRRPVL